MQLPCTSQSLPIQRTSLGTALVISLSIYLYSIYGPFHDILPFWGVHCKSERNKELVLALSALYPSVWWFFSTLSPVSFHLCLTPKKLHYISNLLSLCLTHCLSSCLAHQCTTQSSYTHIQPVSYKRYLRCNNCFLLLVYTHKHKHTSYPIYYSRGEFMKRIWEMSPQLYVTLYTLSIYTSAHKQLRQHLLNPFYEIPCILYYITY